VTIEIIMSLIQKIKKQNLDKTFVSDFSKLVSGTFLANLLPVLISPILSRLYSPESFGVFGIYISIVNILTIILTGRYEFAIVKAGKKSEAIYLLYLITLLSLGITFISLIIITLLFILVPDLSISNHIWIYAIPVTAFAVAGNRTLYYYSTYLKDYGLQSRNRIYRGLNVSAFKIGFFLPFHQLGLIVGNFFGYFITLFIYLFTLIKRRQLVFPSFNFKKIKAGFFNHLFFPRYDLLSGLLNAFSLNLPIILFAFYYSKEIIGQYSMAFSLINMPIVLVAASMGQIYYQRISIPKNKSETKIITGKIINQLSVYGLVLSVVLVFGDVIFGFVLGKEWILAGRFAQYMSLWIYIVFIASPLSHLFYHLSKQQTLMIFNIILFFFRTLILIFTIYIFDSVEMVVLIYCLSGFFFWLFLLIKESTIAGLNYTRVLYKALIPFVTISMLLFIIRIILI